MTYKVNKIIYGTDRSLSKTKREGYFEICLYLRVQLTNWSFLSVLSLLFDSFQPLPTIDIDTANFLFVSFFVEHDIIQVYRNA